MDVENVPRPEQFEGRGHQEEDVGRIGHVKRVDPPPERDTDHDPGGHQERQQVLDEVGAEAAAQNNVRIAVDLDPFDNGAPLPVHPRPPG